MKSWNQSIVELGRNFLRRYDRYFFRVWIEFFRRLFCGLTGHWYYHIRIYSGPELGYDHCSNCYKQRLCNKGLACSPWHERIR